jgi:hypothetical protein
MMPTEEKGKFQFTFGSAHSVMCIMNALVQKRPTKESFLKRISFSGTIGSHTCASDIYWVEPTNFSIHRLADVPNTTFFSINRFDEKYQHTLKTYSYIDYERVSKESLIYNVHKDTLKVVINNYEKSFGGLVMNGHHITTALPDNLAFKEALFYPSDRYHHYDDPRVLTENNEMSPVFIIMEHIYSTNLEYHNIVRLIIIDDDGDYDKSSKNDDDDDNDDNDDHYSQTQYWSDGGTTLYE